MASPSVRWPITPPSSATGQPREPLIFTAMDLRRYAPAPRLEAESGGILVGLLVGLPLSFGLWALLWALV